MDQVESDFAAALDAVGRECRKIGYAPTGFEGMIRRSTPFEAVRSLLDARDPSGGFTTLWEKKRLDLSVEAIVLKPEWRKHFTALQLETARRRLKEVDYRAPWDEEPASSNQHGEEIQQLLNELTTGPDKSKQKSIRARLRALGYFGGLRTRESDIKRGAERSNLLPATVGAKVVADHSTTLVLPPITDAEALLTRIRSISGLPERNHEDVVKDLLLGLGFDAKSIIFQRGRIDICVLNEHRKPVAVFEVKRTIAVESERAGARRQGLDYAAQTGALIVVITDGDRYEIYDRRKGHDYDSMLCGRFQLTEFRPEDSKTLDLLRSSSLCG